MSVLIETSKGDLVVDLFVDDCPKTSENFLKLCKIKYYNNCLFYNVQRNFLVQTGDPTNTGRGGNSIFGELYGEQARFFPDEIHPHLRHKKKGRLGMASAGQDMNASQFYLTTGDALSSLDDRHTVFGELAEGWDVLEAIDEAPCDDNGRPLQNIRIRHTIVLEDPFPDQPTLAHHIPEMSPPLQFADDGRLEDDWVPDEDTRPPEEIEAVAREREARGRAVVLEMIGDLPAADVAPPDNMLFVCKLNPVTTEEDLEIIFSRFGNVTSCDIIRDWKTGDSLCYAFVGFETQRACEEAYFKMNNVLIDDRRIKVDFSQSVHHLWKQFSRFGRRGDAGLGREADQHQRGQGQSGNLQLKESVGRRDQAGYSLLLGEGEEGGGGVALERERGDGDRIGSRKERDWQDGRPRREAASLERVKRRRREDDADDRERQRDRSRERYRSDRHRDDGRGEGRRRRSRSRSRDGRKHSSRRRNRSRDRSRSRTRERRYGR